MTPTPNPAEQTIIGLILYLRRYWPYLVGTALILFMIMQVYAGVIRWLFASLAYVPTLLMLMAVVSRLFLDVVFRQTSMATMFLITLLAFGFVVGAISTPKIVQPIFALWVFVPLFFGMAAAPLALADYDFKNKILMFLMLSCAIGVIVNSVVSYPWVGISYEVAGVEVAGAREWVAAGGKQRLSGLARSSFDVAGQLLVFASLVALNTRHFILRMVLWGISGYAISLSTSKGILLSLLMVIVSVELLRARWGWAMRCLTLLGLVWMLLPPMMGWFGDWTDLNRTDINHPIYGSYIDRMHDMWPRALELATVHGYAIFGRGLGGIGVPLSMFEPDLENAGDNLFVYLFAVFGVIAIPLMTVGALTLLRMCRDLEYPAVRQTLLLSVAILWYGGVSNIVEHAVMSLAFGVLCGMIVRYLAGQLTAQPPALAGDSPDSPKSVEAEPTPLVGGSPASDPH